MKKINLNREKLQSKKLQLMKDKISDLSNENMLNVLGGSGYISQVVRCGPTGPGGCVVPTTALASCQASWCGC
ncbi:class I lanthipeptide [Mucilaginibacter terrenus]|uniref:class I lanthipeptide n=1 Tax=Mucilaginibacter terrenus TaxID=2482727 RepID=UPI0010583B6E